MRLCCDCGCRRELNRCGNGNYTWFGTQFDKNKRFIKDDHRLQWEQQRKQAQQPEQHQLPFVNGHAALHA